MTSLLVYLMVLAKMPCQMLGVSCSVCGVRSACFFELKKSLCGIYSGHDALCF